MGFQDNVNVDVRGAAHIAPCTYKTVVLKQNITKQNLNVLTQAMLDEFGANTKFVIKWDYTLKDNTITIPQGCLIEFDGGSISNGTLIGQNTILIYDQLLNTILTATLDGTWKHEAGSIIVDEEDITGINGKISLKNRSTTDGMGRIILRKNKSFASQLTQENTIYEIRYNFEIIDDVTIPANCILEFDGGSLSGASLNGINGFTIDGYGCKCPLINSEKISFIKPYCVSTTHGFKTGADGSPNKPYYYLQDALNICNNIVIERNSVLWIDQAIYTKSIVTVTPHAIGKLVYDTCIDVYGVGRNPVFTGLCIVSGRNSSTITTNKYRFDFSNAYFNFYNTYYKHNSITYIKVSEHPELMNFGLYSDRVNLLSRDNNVLKVKDESTAEDIYSQQGDSAGYVPTNNSDGIPKGNDYLTYISIGPKPYTYQNIISAGCTGLHCDSHSVTIRNVIIEYVGAHGISGARKSTTVENCLFRYIGGCIQLVQGTPNWVRYGNAVENYASDGNYTFNVSKCSFDIVFDAAITIQGTPSSALGANYIYDNIISNSRFGLEFFTSKPDDSTYSNYLYAQVFNNKIKHCKYTKHYIWYQINGEGSNQSGGFGAIAQGWLGLPNLFVYSNEILDSVFIYSQVNDYQNACVLVDNILFVTNGDIVLNGYNTQALRKYANIMNPYDISNYLNNIGKNGGNIVHIKNNIPISGSTSQRPTLESTYKGYMYFDTTIGKPIYWNGTAWVDATGATI